MFCFDDDAQRQEQKVPLSCNTTKVYNFYFAHRQANYLMKLFVTFLLFLFFFVHFGLLIQPSQILSWLTGWLASRWLVQW